jgi:hypothetical protein
MKTIPFLGLIVIGSLLLSCEHDLEQPLPSVPFPPTEVPTIAKTVVNFDSPGIVAMETSPEPVEIVINLSRPVLAAGKVVINVLSDGPDRFTTDPPMLNGNIVLNAAIGDSVLRFTAMPVNDNEISGHTRTTFLIAFVEGSLIKGSNLDHVLTMRDDELAQKIMGYETAGSGDVVKRVYEYDSKGRIARVNWETYSPYKRSGTDTWFYDENDRLIRINKLPGRDVHYVWDFGKLWKEEVYQNGALEEYTIYSYDMHGNISGAHPYYRQHDGTFTLTLFSVFEYFSDGNIHKALMYSQTGEDDPVLVSAKTYDNYIDVDNNLPMIEILPNVRSQTKLATSYRVEENGFDFSYSISYEFREDGLPVKRIATAAGVSQTTAYYYY